MRPALENNTATATATVSIERKKEEALRRLKELRIFPQTVEQFRRSNKVSRSEPPFGACFWVEDEDLEHLREFERKYNALVYFVIRSITNIGVMDTYLYVSDDEEEWADDYNDLIFGESVAYVNNLSAPECSEFGRVGIAPTPAAGLRRVW